jgi:dTDP-4-dehydrorhamnose 3,5-epimerase/reductase
MTRLAETGVAPTVVGDQFGRLTFAEEIAKATHHLVRSSAPFGTYHVSQRGPVQSWADIAREVFSHLGHDPGRVRQVTSAEYFSGRPTIAPRPRYSTLDLTKIQASGFHPRLSHTLLPEYLASSRTK